MLSKWALRYLLQASQGELTLSDTWSWAMASSVQPKGLVSGSSHLPEHPKASVVSRTWRAQVRQLTQLCLPAYTILFLTEEPGCVCTTAASLHQKRELSATNCKTWSFESSSSFQIHVATQPSSAEISCLLCVSSLPEGRRVKPSVRNTNGMVQAVTNFAFLEREEISQDKCYLKKLLENTEGYNKVLINS